MRKPPTQQQVTSHVTSWSSGELPKKMDVDPIQTEGGRGGGGGYELPPLLKSQTTAKPSKLMPMNLATCP